MNSAPRVLVISHAHPDFSLGGGELAAYMQWQEMRRRGIPAMFLARCAEFAGHPGAPFAARSADGMDLLFGVPPVNHFRHSQPQSRVVFESFRELLENFKPTAIHFHHYVHLGLEFIREARKYSKSVTIAVTLHEFLAICHAQGQMLKTSGLLCNKAAPLDCHVCFPDISPQDFFMRELFVKSFFSLVDCFLCPSTFLRDRYVAWGLPPEKMVVLENGQAPQPIEPEVKEPNIERRFVVLGQQSKLKGTLVLLDAVRLLSPSARQKIRVEIHGSIQWATDDFKKDFARKMEELGDTVRLCGPYMPEHVTGILRRNGWLVVPSIWWENSPLVIQEAFAAGRPVICSNVGGMAEKVQPGKGGFHFRVNNAADLAARMEYCAGDPAVWESLCQELPKPPSVQETVDRLMLLYARTTSTAETPKNPMRKENPSLNR